ncbi:MAG: serine hydrolase domain-containing protein [Candidatus Dadabacteria bacterium]
MKRPSKKIRNRILLLILLIGLGYAGFYAWRSFPIISGFSAKNACSCTFIQGRSKQSIQSEELGMMPLSLASIDINLKDSSVTGSVWGVAKRKAIYREGVGCTLVNDIPEQQVRKQQFNIPVAVATSDTSSWLYGHGESNVKMNKALMDSALKFVFHHKYKEKDANTRAVLVVQNGKIIAERYAPGYNKDSRFLGWSMAKSITGTLIGILVKEGKLSLNAPAPLDQWKNPKDKRHSISIENLLQQTSGLNFVENYNSYSDVTNMLFDRGDMAAFAAALPLKQKPGTYFYYSSGNSNILSYIIRKTVGEKDYHAFPYNTLFHKIGMNHALLEPDASGTFVGSSYVYASARDYARFGLLLLNDGVWNSERILPEGWVKKSTSAPGASILKDYGYQIWLNGFDKNNTGARQFPEAPPEMFFADGFGGQRIYIIPSLHMVIVRMGLDLFDEHTFLKKLFTSVQ